ncbi:hypothetical protein [Streptomyces sp. ME01-18a]|uniref:hypothetical protein n=1 Tax=Streptomyces sp. ME01-18a TaxID=3028669 RepID=UPI0039F6647E
MEDHAKRAGKAGASKADMAEAVMVAATLCAGSGVTRGWKAMKCTPRAWIEAVVGVTRTATPPRFASRALAPSTTSSRPTRSTSAPYTSLRPIQRPTSARHISSAWESDMDCRPLSVRPMALAVGRDLPVLSGSPRTSGPSGRPG